MSCLPAGPRRRGSGLLLESRQLLPGQHLHIGRGFGGRRLLEGHLPQIRNLAGGMLFHQLDDIGDVLYFIACVRRSFVDFYEVRAKIECVFILDYRPRPGWSRLRFFGTLPDDSPAEGPVFCRSRSALPVYAFLSSLSPITVYSPRRIVHPEPERRPRRTRPKSDNSAESTVL